MKQDLYMEAMTGIRETVAMQAIRKVIRSKDADTVKLDSVIAIVHSYERDAEIAAEDAERREYEAEEEERRLEESRENVERMMAPLNNLMDIAKGKK